MMELLEIPFTGPVLPATVLVIFAVAWSMLSIAGAVDIEGWFGHHAEFDLDPSTLDGGSLDGAAAHDGVLDAHGPTISQPPGHRFDGFADGHGVAKGFVSAASIAALRWLNIGGVPITIWGAIFAVAWWFVAGFLWIGMDRFLFSPNAFWSTLLTAKNLFLAALLTKLVTAPIKRNLTPHRITTQSLIGKECTISSSVADQDFGLVKFKTGGAPLLLNVRTDGPQLARGTPVWITHYDKDRRVYIVTPTSTRDTDSDAERLQGESEGADL